MKCIAWLLLLIPLAPLSMTNMSTPVPNPPRPVSNPLTVTPPALKTSAPDAELQRTLTKVHAQLEKEFGSTPGNGLSRVIRMRRHGMPNFQKSIDGVERILVFAFGDQLWQIKDFELVGMMESAPVVFITPISSTGNKSEIVFAALQAKKREPDDFEKHAISSLADAQQLEKLVANVSGDEIRMVGPLHATADCLSCHTERTDENGKSVKLKQGDVLGALTYHIKRLDPELWRELSRTQVKPLVPSVQSARALQKQSVIARFGP
jgi:hypothetical protein